MWKHGSWSLHRAARRSGIHPGPSAESRRSDHRVRTCLKIEPENPAFYYFLGSLYDNKRDEENVIRYYREYLDRGGLKYQKKAIFVLQKLGVEVETASDALTSVDESLFRSEPSAESPESSD